MASRLMSNFSSKNESSIDIEQGSLGEYSNGSIVHSPDIKVDESQETIFQANPEATNHTPIVPEQSIPLEKTPLAHRPQDAKPKERGAGIERRRDANVLFGTLLAMTPAKEFVFPPNEGLRDSHEVLSLYNANKNQPVAFKIQTTSPDGYRVVPPMGVIDAHRQADVVITLLPGHRHAAHDDKFLLTAMTLSERRVKLSLRSKSIWTIPLSDGEVRTENRFSCRVLDEEDCSTSDDAGDTNIFKGFHETTPLIYSSTPEKLKPQKLEGVETRMRMLFSFIIGTLLLFILFLLCLLICFSFGAIFTQEVSSPTHHAAAAQAFYEATHNSARAKEGTFPV